jgi:site-specific DNA-methyltransferase (adenine-specific)
MKSKESKKLNKLEIVYISASNLVKLHGNPRRDKDPKAVERLAKLIKAHGFQNPLQVYAEKGKYTIIAGNHRFDAGLSLGMKEFPCLVYTGDRKAALARAISDNQSNEWTEFDIPLLKEILIELDTGDFDMYLTGFNSHEIELMMTAEFQDEGGTADAEPQIDRAEELNKVWKVKTGDLWQIGEHRLLCGDSTKKEDVGRVMGGEKADMVTDPPYGVNVTKKASVAPGIKFDDQEWDVDAPSGEVLAFLLSQTDKAVIWGGNCMALPVAPRWLAWDKQTDGMTFAEMELAWTNIKGVPRMFRQRPQNMDGGKQHPTQKPISLMTWCLSFLENRVILDPFLGSGTTMVACQNLNRKCRGIEISPEYCSVVLQRMTDAFPGIEIKRIK